MLAVTLWDLEGKMGRLLSIEKVAEELGISHWTVRRLLKSKKLAAIRIGRRCLVDVDEIERFKQECKAVECLTA